MSASKEIEIGKDMHVKFDDKGLVPAIVQDIDTRDILMLAYMNEDALKHTIESGKATFYSRSRGKMWVKGESSGNEQLVQELRVDCDQDTVLLLVKSQGPACHVGYHTCFYRAVEKDASTLSFVEEQVYDPDEVYGKK